MSDNYKKDKLEDLFKGSFDDLTETPAENGWDMPSDGVWNRVDANLRPRGKRRGGLVWWMLGIGLVIIAGWAIYWTAQQGRSDSNDIENKIEIVESTDRNNLENDIKEETVTEGYLNEAQNSNENTELKDEIDVVESKGNIETADAPFFNSRGKTKDTNVSEKTPQTIVTEVSEQRQRPANNKNNTTGILSEQASKDEINDEGLVNTDALKDQNAEAVPVESNHNNKVDGMVTVSVSDTVSLKPRIVEVDLLQPLPLKIKELTHKSQEDLPGMTYEANDFITPIAPKMAGLYVGLEASVLQSYRTIMAKREFVIPRFYEEEEPDISLGYGVNVGYQLSRNWSIESGLNYTSTALGLRARRQIQYTMVDEQPAGGGEFQSDYKLPFETSNGTIDSDVAVARSASTQLAENDFIALSLRGEQNFSYLNVPILARYHFGKGRWQVGLKGGVVNRILLDASFQFTSISTARQGLRVVVNDRFFRKRTLDKVNDYQVDFEIGAGLRFLATEQLWIYAEPTYRRSINPSHEGMNFKTFPTVKAIELGMNWRF